MTRFDVFQKRMNAKEKLLLSGAFGTELTRRGVPTDLPLWSAPANVEHPDVVRAIHLDYLQCNVDLISTNTFRTNRRTLEKVGKTAADARAWTQAATTLAQEARKQSGRDSVVIGGSMASLEDCYQPDIVPPDSQLLPEHAEHAKNLADSGVDFLFIETINCIREAVACMKGASATKLPTILSFVCNRTGDLLSGERIEDAVAAVLPYKPVALFTNCAPPDVIDASVQRLLAATTLPVGVHANGDGGPQDVAGWAFTGKDLSASYAEYGKKWWAAGATVVGACCGSNPSYIRKLDEVRKQLV